jgi:hypothetical protein
MNKKITEYFDEQCSPALRELDRRPPPVREPREQPRRNGARRLEPREAQPVSRRTAIGRISAGVLLTMGLWPGALRAAGNGGARAFRFIVVNDTHAVSPECGDYFHKLAQQMRKEEPEFVLHAGDVTDKGEKNYFGLIKEALGPLLGIQ